MKLFAVARVVFGLVLLVTISACGGNDAPTADTTPPDTSITSSPPALSNSPDASFEFTSTEAGSTFEISLDGATFVTGSSPYTINGLSDGPHSIEVRAIDAAGNVDATVASYSWNITTSITVTSCSPAAGDSTENIDGSTSFNKSHLFGSPVYHVKQTREDASASTITIDYMVHQPTGTPKGIILLVAGGNLDAGIEGTTDGSVPTNSRGNFLVRSAHRYQAQGYRVITIDRPSDFATYGTAASYQMDSYRNSMRHAVDIATVLKHENAEGYNVILSGTSRGAISVAANNTLASAIALSSPVTAGAVGSPVGSASLPLSRIQRVTHILLHTNDTCSVTLPVDSRNLFTSLIGNISSVRGDEVSGGFRDTVRNDVCGAFDYHGFNGIETCAVNKETAWADIYISSLANNSPPVANAQSVMQGDPISLSATDDDGDSLTYAVPYATSSLGGNVATDTEGNVTYMPPLGVSGTIDTFAFTATDGKGGVATAVISITLI